MANKPLVAVAMSGGVDSSVAAALLVKQGYEVVGITLQIWQESQTDPRHSGCCSLGAVVDARRVAKMLGIPHYVLNFRQQFAQTVIADFIEEYRRGRTPNPCVQCNRAVKFDAFLQKANELGAQYIATGHYARIQYDEKSGRWLLLKAINREKDQSYVLFPMTQEQLARTLFPLGELPSKSETRALARELGLPVADKPDSQEICFVAEAGGYRAFLQSRVPDTMRPGEIRDVHGNALGRHPGVAFFTIGQRRGLGISGHQEPLYVVDIDAQHNVVVVGPEQYLYSRRFLVDGVNWIALGRLTGPLAVQARIRYNMPEAPATLFPTDVSTCVEVEFESPQRAITPGQAAVFYRGDIVVGGGTISKRLE
ncbi:MAG: tRNA 2-thiouridine(34) synthase MnmA [Armatimonadota bacterium]|nr:tRNA 2-thiouridine(34) synthase MnmA [bacterium]MDW8322437.1 tRNA 2-thiouridine(34) synthase MnmA [Armatimonadota bacterium]